MKRRSFLYLSGIAAAGLSLKTKEKEIISCGAEPDWKDYVIPAGTTYKVKAGEYWNRSMTVQKGATLIYDQPGTLVHWLGTGSLLNYGTVKIINPDPSKAPITFLHEGVNPNTFVDSLMDYAPSNPGFWTLGSGRLVIQGGVKRRWTDLSAEVQAGSNTINVVNCNGWQVGDEIMIATTDKPTVKMVNGVATYPDIDWDDKNNVGIDAFASKFERRIVSKIEGTKITLSSNLLFDHNNVYDSLSGKTLKPGVQNLTSNIKLQGQPGHCSHIFIMSSGKQEIAHAEISYMGVRRPGYRAGKIVLGAYALHFHHCGDITGSFVKNCSFHNNFNRVVVTHFTNKVVCEGNAFFDNMGEILMWDFQSISHYVTYKRNFGAYNRDDGQDRAISGITLGQGDGNICVNNRTAYLSHSDLQNAGDYNWKGDNEGSDSWIFENNTAHSTYSGFQWWLNSPIFSKHMKACNAFSCVCPLFLGAYGNGVKIEDCVLMGKSIIKASSGQWQQNIEGGYFNANGEDYCFVYIGSQAPSPPANRIINSKFSGYKEAVIYFDIEPVVNTQKKVVELYNPDYAGEIAKYSDAAKNYGCKAVIINETWNNGTGLKGEYYNGANFENFAFSRIDPVIIFTYWNKNTDSYKYAPDGVHHLITGSNYSVRWTGKVMAKFTGEHSFYINASSGSRLWVDGKQILNNWQSNVDATIQQKSVSVYLTNGEQYDLKLEYFHTVGLSEITLSWFVNGMQQIEPVPRLQLFPSNFAQATSEKLVTKEVEGLNVFPNPSAGIFYVKTKAGQKITVINFAGKVVQQKTSNGNTKFIIQQPGIYVINSQQFSEKIIITK